ncbi:hypothetical protein C9374_007332 [Naegleria lovaniensis]|uniref:DUF803-domain-containing protein n=1 Tax=Naegleria lovaniensis TaxID=51637 RepID=A0AA88GMV8_NAELO|nr:uncharacterized protein C9374_007332 [Naegleria lovaniensis]KAG2379193.1 hypothetical protein C9374_007332 [Naegleria lovaniensis]
MIANALANFANYKFYVGFVFSLVGSVFYFLGLAILKYAHMKNSEQVMEYRTHYLKDTRWWTLFTMFIFGWICEMISFAFVELTLVVSVLSFGVFIGVFYTAWYIAEKITRRDQLGVVITSIGIIISIIFSDKVYQPLHPITISFISSQIIDFNIPILFVIFLVVLPFIFILLSIFRPFKNVFFSASISSSFAASNFILFKLFIELVKTSAETNENQFMHWGTYVILGLSILYTILHTHFTQVTLVSYEFTVSNVLYYIIMSFLTVCGGELIFREWSDTSVLQLVLLFLGWFLQFIGVLLLLGSHTNANSMYPLTQLNDPRGGHLVRVSDVDLDFDSDSDNEKSHTSHHNEERQLNLMESDKSASSKFDLNRQEHIQDSSI